jgi:hypothetical protein
MIQKTWGVRFNRLPNCEHLKNNQKPQDCPDWLSPHQVRDWQGEGLIVWNNDEKRMARLSGTEGLGLLAELISKDDWKTQGVSIKRPVFRIALESQPRGRQKNAIQEPVTEPQNKKPVFEEIVCLPSEAGLDLVEIIQENKHHINEMAQQEKVRFDQTIGQIYNMLFESYRKSEQNDFDLSDRSFIWGRRENNRWSCQNENTEGRICLDKSLLFWHACVQRRGFMGRSERFTEFRVAVDWVENNLVELAIQPSQPESHSHIHPLEQIEADHARLKQQYLNGPFWIRPTALEPEHVAYQIFIELEAEPGSYKTFESVCGDSFRVDERYLTPSKQAAAIGLDFDQFSIYQPLGDNSKWYQFTSLTAYYQQSSAAEQAQNIWGHSQILQQFKVGKIFRGRYGYKEVGTGFVEYLGTCEHSEKPWGRAESREEYLEQLALRETLCFALAVNDFRDYLGLSSEMVSDEELLVTMHKDRAKSKCMSEETKLESKLWLARNEPVE